MRDQRHTGETAVRQRKSEQVQILKEWAQGLIDETVALGKNLGSIQREMTWNDDGSLTMKIHVDFGDGTNGWGEYSRTISSDLQTQSVEGKIRQ